VSLSAALNAASRDASLDPRGSHRFLRASLRGCRSVACGVALVCTQPLSVSAGQRLPVARTPPGHELESITRAGFEFRRGLPHVPSIRLSLAVPWLTLEPGCLSLGKQLRVASGLPTTPVDYGPTEPPGRRPPAPGPRRFTSPSGGCRITPDLILLTVPELVSSLAALSLGRSAGRTEVSPQPLSITVRQNPLAADLLRQVLNLSSSPGGYRIAPDLILLTAPGVWLSLVVLVTRPRRRPDSGVPGTPADCGPAEPPGLPWKSQVPILCRGSFRSPFPGGDRSRTVFGSPSRILTRRVET